MSAKSSEADRLFTTRGYGSPSGKPFRKSKKFTIDLDNPDDCELLLKSIASGNPLTEPAPAHKLPKNYAPVFRHPLPISDHSAIHDANLKRGLCCTYYNMLSCVILLFLTSVTLTYCCLINTLLTYL
jgi:hypothetical protein